MVKSTKTNAVEPKTTKCPISKAVFLVKGPLAVDTLKAAMNGLPITAREFSTGSFGFGCSDKLTLVVDGKPVKFQVSLNITAIGSKDAG